MPLQRAATLTGGLHQDCGLSFDATDTPREPFAQSFPNKTGQRFQTFSPKRKGRTQGLPACVFFPRAVKNYFARFMPVMFSQRHAATQASAGDAGAATAAARFCGKADDSTEKTGTKRQTQSPCRHTAPCQDAVRPTLAAAAGGALPVQACRRESENIVGVYGRPPWRTLLRHTAVPQRPDTASGDFRGRQRPLLLPQARLPRRPLPGKGAQPRATPRPLSRASLSVLSAVSLCQQLRARHPWASPGGTGSRALP